MSCALYARLLNDSTDTAPTTVKENKKKKRASSDPSPSFFSYIHRRFLPTRALPRRVPVGLVFGRSGSPAVNSTGPRRRVFSFSGYYY